jgi:hypothetical protein
MNLPNSVRVRYDDLRSLTWGAAPVPTAYVGVGPTFTHAPRMIKFCNFTNVNLLVSFDGITRKDVIPANTHIVYDYGSNKADQGGFLEASVGDRVYVAAEAGVWPVAGTFYVTVIYASQA